MAGDWTFLSIGAGGWLALLSALAVAALAGVALRSLRARLRAAQAQIDTLAEQLAQVREQSQHESLAIGQRVMEMDKLLRRLGERIDGMEHAQPAEARYGQLQTLVSDVALRDENAVRSEAEEKLLALLRRGAN